MDGKVFVEINYEVFEFVLDDFNRSADLVKLTYIQSIKKNPKKFALTFLLHILNA